MDARYDICSTFRGIVDASSRAEKYSQGHSQCRLLSTLNDMSNPFVEIGNIHNIPIGVIALEDRRYPQLLIDTSGPIGTLYSSAHPKKQSDLRTDLQSQMSLVVGRLSANHHLLLARIPNPWFTACFSINYHARDPSNDTGSGLIAIPTDQPRQIWQQSWDFVGSEMPDGRDR